MSDVFICHVEEDSKIALGLTLGLEKSGLQTYQAYRAYVIWESD